MWFLTLIVLILILGLIILVHEFGHFICAKKFGVHIYEFSIGMGPILKTIKGKDGIDYNLRAFPIGGFVAMAGEVYEDDDLKKIPKDKFMCNKPWWQRIIILGAGVFNNFVLAILVLFICGLIWGAESLEPVMINVPTEAPAYLAGMREGDTITKVNGHKTGTWDMVRTYLSMKDNDNTYEITVKHKDGKEEVLKVAPKEEEKDGKKTKTFGFGITQEKEKGFLSSIKYGFNKFGSLISSMWVTIVNLFTGKIALKELSGPVGIYSYVGQSLSAGAYYVISLIALLSANVGLINILPIPAFDGGRIFFLIIEKIKRSPINSKFESTCHTIFFILLILLMIYITIFDIIRFK